MGERRFDIIVIGAGPNGLELGAYLSRAGLKVLLLERRLEVGGGLATEEVTLPEYRHNTHAVYMMMVDYAPVYNDFELERNYRVRHIHPTLEFALPLTDGRCLGLYSDVDKTCASIAQFSRRDAEAYRTLARIAQRAVSRFIGPATYVPAVPALDQLVALQQTEIGRELAEFSEKSPKQLVDEYFENAHVKALMLYLTTHWGLGYNDAGMGYLFLLYLDRAANYRLVVGGSHNVAQSLHKIICENGGVVMNSRLIRRIILDNGRASGVELEDGTVFTANKAVVSTLDPNQTFLNLVGKENLDGTFGKKIEGWMWEKYSLMGLHLALKEAPRFTAAAANPEIDKAFIYLLGYETDAELIADYEATYGGELRKQAGFNCCFPTVHDPSQAPPGRHTGLLSRFAPHQLKDGGAERWYSVPFKEEVAEQYLTTLRKYAPNMNEDTILWKYLSTPVDVENKFLDMAAGSIKQGLYHPFQMGYFRPSEECSQHRTPVKSLYLAGSCCYPGGCIIWGPGYLAANAIAEDLGIDKWWSEPEMISKARNEGLL